MNVFIEWAKGGKCQFVSVKQMNFFRSKLRELGFTDDIGTFQLSSDETDFVSVSITRSGRIGSMFVDVGDKAQETLGLRWDSGRGRYVTV